MGISFANSKSFLCTLDLHAKPPPTHPLRFVFVPRPIRKSSKLPPPLCVRVFQEIRETTSRLNEQTFSARRVVVARCPPE